MYSLTKTLASRKVLLFDGATGTQLAARGAIQGPLSNLEFPEIVKSVHRDYKDAGADIILTNTLTANRIALDHAGLADKFEQINICGVELAREAAGSGCWVAGDMTSTGKFLEPLGEFTEQQFHDNFAEQAKLLADCGVDLIIIETMTDVCEAAIATRAAKEATGLPVITTIAFDSAAGDFRTMMGDTVEKAVSDLTAAGADAIGANCGTLDPDETSRVIHRMRELVDGILAAQPNAGKPEVSAGQVSFRLSPEVFADGAIRCVQAGAALIGGCCGTTPAHIAALAGRAFRVGPESQSCEDRSG